MKAIVLLGALALLAGCRHPDRRGHIVPVTPAPIADSRLPAPVEHTSPAAPKQPVSEVRPSKIDTTMRPARPDPTRIIADINGRLLDIYFAYDRAELSNEALQAAQENATLLAPILSEFPSVTAWVEGHCDERGSAEYNLALGDNRASSVANLLRKLGIDGSRMQTISYGREKPQCMEPAEACWQKNRRAHIMLRDGDATHQ